MARRKRQVGKVVRVTKKPHSYGEAMIRAHNKKLKKFGKRA